MSLPKGVTGAPGAPSTEPAANSAASKPARAGSRPQVARGVVPAGDGLLLVDKSAGITSHDVVGAVRRMAATRKVGHAGTLDPMATGLLVLGVGRATRLLTYLVGADKTYLATVRLGQETLTEDAEGEITRASGCPKLPEPAQLERALAALTGEISQVPSAVSAIKVGGVRSYARVRQGEQVELAARPVRIHELQVLGQPRSGWAADGTVVVDLDLQVSCSSGTYVRALARDLGEALGCGAHLTSLRRTVVGPFDIGQADTLTALSAQVQADAGESRQGLSLMSLNEAARCCFAALELSEEQARAVSYGQHLPASLLRQAQAPSRPIASKAADGKPVVAGFAPDGQVVALLAPKGERARPLLVLRPA